MKKRGDFLEVVLNQNAELEDLNKETINAYSSKRFQNSAVKEHILIMNFGGLN
jgi:hypothetical protein